MAGAKTGACIALCVFTFCADTYAGDLARLATGGPPAGELRREIGLRPIKLAQSSNRDAADRITFMRKTNAIALDIVRRETGRGNLVHFIKSNSSLAEIKRDLQIQVGPTLARATNGHKHNIGEIIDGHLGARGWPAVSYFRIGLVPIRSVCVVSPLSHDRRAFGLVAIMIGNPRLPVIYRVAEYDVRLLSVLHEGYHCISAHRSVLDIRQTTLIETISDIGAANEGLRAGLDTSSIVALADLRAIRFASGIADAVAGRITAEQIYLRVSPAHMSAVGIIRLLSVGPLDSYERIETLARAAMPSGLYGQKKEAQIFLNKIFLLHKNAVAQKRYPNAALQDADDILSLIGAPPVLIRTIQQSVSRYVAKLDCRRNVVNINMLKFAVVVCRQGDGSHAFAGHAILGVKQANGLRPRNNFWQYKAANGLDPGLAKSAFESGQAIAIPAHRRHHRGQTR